MPKKPIELYAGADTHMIARRMARQGHRDWLCWMDRNGNRFAARCTAANLKAAMLATGTQGRFTRYEASTGTALSSSSWSVATIWLKNQKYEEKQS